MMHYTELSSFVSPQLISSHDVMLHLMHKLKILFYTQHVVMLIVFLHVTK